MSSNSKRSYDPNVIIKAANDKLKSNDVAGGQTLFQSALLNWVDDARETEPPSDQMQEAIATLWVAYTQFLQTAKQYKSTTEAFEQAVECPVSGHVGRIWLEYARFLEDRNKPKTAQQVYIRALTTDGGAVRDEQDRNLLWNSFLEMMRTVNDPDLTLQDLQQAIDIQEQPSTSSADNFEPPASKRPRLYSSDHSLSSIPAVASATATATATATAVIKREEGTLTLENEPPTRTHVVTATDVSTEAQASLQLVDPQTADPAWKATWMVRDGDAPPQPPLSLFEAAPPKLSDATGKDMLGEELALGLIQRLLQTDGSVVLQVSKALWMLTLLKERSTQNSLKALDDSIEEEWKQLSSRLDERLSVAGAAEAAVRQINETERQAFQATVNQKRQHLISHAAWEFRQVLWQQQQLFCKLQIPGFDDLEHAITSEPAGLEFQSRICRYLHSAFFLRQRIKEPAHVSMLKNQEKKLQQQVNALQQQQQQQPPPASLPPPPRPLNLPPPPPQQQPYGGYDQYGGGLPPPPPHNYQQMPPQHYPTQNPPPYYQQ